MQFAGTSEALYERHLLFDTGVDLHRRPPATGSKLWRDPCETFSRNDGF